MLMLVEHEGNLDENIANSEISQAMGIQTNSFFSKNQLSAMNTEVRETGCFRTAPSTSKATREVSFLASFFEEDEKMGLEENIRKEAEGSFLASVFPKAKTEAEEAKEKARTEADEMAKRESDEKTKKEAKEKAKIEAEEKAKREAEEKEKQKAEKKTKIQAEEKAKIEAEVNREYVANRKAEEKAKLEAEKKAKREAEKMPNLRQTRRRKGKLKRGLK